LPRERQGHRTGRRHPWRAQGRVEAPQPAPATKSRPIASQSHMACVGQIEYLCEDGTVVFNDGSRLIADSIIYCTGYDFSYPFLDTGGVVTMDDN
jgi:hypothetical protein